MTKTAIGPAVEAAALEQDPGKLLKNSLVDLFEEGGGKLYEAIEGCVMPTAYEYCHRNQLETARLLGLSRNIVRARLLQYGELSGRPRGRQTHEIASSVS